MQSGIYAAVFKSNNNTFGSGVAVFFNHAIHGGDAAYYYRGKCILGENQKITGNIDVVKYSNVSNSVFGPLNSFRLLLNGVVKDNGFELSGQVEGKPQLMITITLQKMEELIEQD